MRYVRVQAGEEVRWGVLEGETVFTLERAPYEGICRGAPVRMPSAGAL